jgi:hypothetical protein
MMMMMIVSGFPGFIVVVFAVVVVGRAQRGVEHFL